MAYGRDDNRRLSGGSGSDDDDSPSVEDFENRARDVQNDRDSDDSDSGGWNNPDKDGDGVTDSDWTPSDRDTDDDDDSPSVEDFENRARDVQNEEPTVEEFEQEARDVQNEAERETDDGPDRDSDGGNVATDDMQSRRLENPNRNLEENVGLANELGISREVAILENQFLDEYPEFETPGRKDEYSIEYDESTGKLSVETTDEYRKRKRREFEQQILASTPAESPEDVVIREVDGALKASFSEAFKTNQRKATRDSLAEKVIEETAADSRDDFRIREEDGRFVAEFTQDFVSSRNEARADSVSNIPGAEEGLREEARRLEADAVSNIPGAEEGVEEEIARELANSLGVDVDRVSVDYNAGRPTADVEEPASPSDSTRETVASVDVLGTELAVETDSSERFGDFQVSVNGTSGEDLLDGLSEDYDRFVSDVSAFNRSYNPVLVASRETYGAIDPYLPGDTYLENAETGRLRSEEFVVGGVEGAFQLANIPATARGLDEAGEFLGYAASQTLAGRGGQTAGAAKDATDAAVAEGFDALAESPGRNVGMLAGSLVTSVGVLGGAAKVSNRAGRVARYAIQPGEEILSDGATAALRSRRLNAATSRVGLGDAGNRVVEKFPGGRIDNEEILLKAGQRASSRLSRSIRRARYDVAGEFGIRQGRTVQSFLRDSRGQVQIPRSPSVESETGGYEPPADLLDDSLTQSQDLLRASAEAEIEAEREQLGDVGRTGGGLPDQGGINDRLTFDPDEADARLRRAREQPPRARLDDEATRSGVDWQRVAELERGDRAAARRSSFESVETELEREEEDLLSIARGGRPETLLDDGLLDRAEASSFVEESRPGSRAGVESWFDVPGTETDGLAFETLGRDLSREYLSEYETELETEPETEYETDSETELTRMQELELELERELEIELELEAEAEAEIESEAEGARRRQEEIQRRLFAIDGAGKSWRSSIADVDSLLGGWF
jgi:hypothetical protein